MKMLSAQDIQALVPAFSSLEEAQIVDSAGISIGWHCTALAEGDEVLGSGCHADRSEARRVALAETIERALFREIHQGPLALEFWLDLFPSTCGFAAGFEVESTRSRSICEAVERWCWSKWIDEQMPLQEVQFDLNTLSSLGRFFFGQFEHVRLFSNTVTVKVVGEEDRRLQLGILIGCANGGIFPGSRVCSLAETPWEHAIIEAWRHRLIFQNQKASKLKSNLVYDRIAYFGEYGSKGLKQIPVGLVPHWPAAQIALSKQLELPKRSYFLWRSLCAEYRGWHEGTISRFVY